MGLGKQQLTEACTLSLGCRVGVTSGIGSTTIKWSVSTVPVNGGRRPARGGEAVAFTCPRCHRTMSAVVESLGKARTKYWVYRCLGWLLLLSLLVTFPALVHFGGQTVEEGDTETVNAVGGLFAALAVGIVLGPAFLMAAGRYTGVNKLRFVRPDGGKTVWVRGHRLF